MMPIITQTKVDNRPTRILNERIVDLSNVSYWPELVWYKQIDTNTTKNINFDFNTKKNIIWKWKRDIFRSMYIYAFKRHIYYHLHWYTLHVANLLCSLIPKSYLIYDCNILKFLFNISMIYHWIWLFFWNHTISHKNVNIM